MDAHLKYFLECIMFGLYYRNSCFFSLEGNFKNFILGQNLNLQLLMQI